MEWRERLDLDPVFLIPQTRFRSIQKQPLCRQFVKDLQYLHTPLVVPTRFALDYS